MTPTIREQLERFVIEEEAGGGLFRKRSLWALVEQAIEEARADERRAVAAKIREMEEEWDTTYSAEPGVSLEMLLAWLEEIP